MEISIVNKSSVPRIEGWLKILQGYIQNLTNGDKAIMITLAKSDTSQGLESSWRRLARRNKKIPHIKTFKHQLGVTVYLWWK
jgi:hypothetical protein